MNYRILHVSFVINFEKALDELSEQVNDAISTGWEPCGGVCLHGNQIVQAMVRRR